MQNQITKKAKLLNEKGILKNPGWAKDLLLEYHRSDIRASKFKIKEWDYYCILSENKGVAFTIADNSYIGFIAITIFDFDKAEEISNSLIVPLSMGSFNMPPTSKNGDIHFKNKNISLNYIREKESRIIEIDYLNFYQKENLKGKIVLQQADSLESMVIATPFLENKRAFYYNQKINCMPASGELSFGSEKIVFSPENSFGVLDWGRGVWTYSNTWYWGSASGKIDGKLFGFNIGYGFGDTSNATENMIFYDGKAHKFDQVVFHISEDDYLKTWKCAKIEMEDKDSDFIHKFPRTRHIFNV
ncbi:MAG: DUF2804 domain-containing protein, partial [Bacteroidetes bacterium]